MADTVGELKIALSFDSKTLKESQKEVEKETSTLGSKLSSGIKSAGKVAAGAAVAAITATAAGVVKVVKDSFNLSAEYEQLVGGVETMFKDSSDVVIENAQKAYKTAQISANNYMSTITSFSASLLQSLGGDTKKAAEYSNRAVIDMADNANKMGTSMEAIQNAYQGFAKQNFTMLDNLKLGYGGTKTEMERLIKDASEMTDVQKELNVAVKAGDMSFGNMVNAISVVQKKLGIAGTSAKEAAETVSGSFNQMKSAWSNFLTALGDPNGDVEKSMQELMDSIETFLKNAIPLLDRIFEAIIDYLPTFVDMFIEKLPDLIQKLIPKLIEAAVKITFALIKKLPELIAAIFQAIFAGFGTLITELGQGFADLFGPWGESIANFFSGVWETLGAGAQAAWEGIQNVFKGVAEWFGSVFAAAWNAVKAVFETGGRIFMGIVDGIINGFKTIVNGIIFGLNTVIAIPFNTINGILNGIKSIDILGFKPFDWVGTISVPQIPYLAQGGVASGATGAVIGEAGTEAVIPLERNTDNWSGLLASALAEKFNENENGMGRGIVIENQNFNISSKLDAENIGHIMMESIRRQA